MIKAFSFVFVLSFWSSILHASEIDCHTNPTNDIFLRPEIPASARDLIGIDYAMKLSYQHDNWDNNNLASVLIENESCLNTQKSKHLTTQSQIEEVLKKCVFIQNGAYGEAITKVRQTELAKIFSRHLLTKFQVSLIDNTSIVNDIIFAGCLLKISQKNTPYILLVEGYSFD